MQLTITSLFPLGQLVATQNALDQVPQPDIELALQRHAQSDWGDVDGDDRHANDYGLEFGLRILSQYQSQAGVTFWIITEADRSATTVLLPSDY